MALGVEQAQLPTCRDDFEIAVICALPEERDAVEATMTLGFKEHGLKYGKQCGDQNQYTLGLVGGKPVVLVCLSDMGTLKALDCARMMATSFPRIAYALVVGIAGGVPFFYDRATWHRSDIHLGDVVISTQVIQYDHGR